MSDQNSILLVLQPILDKHKHVHAAFYHKSTRSNSLQFLSDHGNDSAILDSWDTFGRATLKLYACRLTLNFPLKKNAAVCTDIISGLFKQLLNQFANEIKKSGLSNFGSGVSQAELDKDESYHGVVFQLIGAIAHAYGYNFTALEVLSKITNVSNLKMPAGKDSKTTLQEYAQRRFKRTPTYMLVDSTGPDHAMIFQIKMDLNGLVFFGFGHTKRAAEQDAAMSFLQKNNIAWNKEVSIDLKGGIDYCAEIKSMARPLNAANWLAPMLESYQLPAWSEPLFALALTHSSSKKHIEISSLGHDNTVLAFVGAHFIQWVAHDTVLSSLSIQEITHAGGIAEVVRQLVSSHKIETIFHNLLKINQVKVGPGVKTILPVLKSEFTQAFCGALFLIREKELCKAKNFFYGISSLQDYFDGDKPLLRVSRDESLPAKTILQELCQSLGIKIQFEKTIVTSGSKKPNKSEIYLQSDFLVEKLCIDRFHEHKENHTRLNFSQFETNLALDVTHHINVYFGKIRNINPEPYIDSWLLSFFVSYSGKFADNRNIRLNKKLITTNFLGTGFLEKNQFIEFEIWYSKAILNFMDQQVDFARVTNCSFYEYSGQISNKTHFEEDIGLYILLLEAALNGLDPLEETFDFCTSNEYKCLVGYASAYKISSSSKTTVKLSDILEQFFLLSRRRDQIKLITDGDIDIYEIQGAHLSLLDLLVSVSSQQSTAAVEITESNGSLIFKLVKGSDKTEQYLPTLEQSSLWKALKTFLPITHCNETEHYLMIFVPCIIKNQIRIDALNAWWSFALHGASNIAANDMIASMLHSLKNDILGYSVSSLRAKSQQSKKDRYQIATEATSHIENALITLKSVRSLISDTVRPEFSHVKVEIFFRSLMTNLWSWIPDSVKLEVSGNDSNIELFTNKDSLNSILVNLIKNSVEALGGQGVISLVCSLDQEHEGFEFLISDSGEGFTMDQLHDLNSGSPISSSKKNGHGLGLMSVILLTNELNGSLSFFNGEVRGANIKVWLPLFSIADEEV